MAINQALLGEYEMEAASTRRVLERVPADKADWKPHDKSFSLGRLALHVAELNSWPTMTLTTTELDLAGGYNPKPFTTTDELLERFDGYVAATKTALAASSDADLMVPWSLRNGSHVIFTIPRVQCLRGMIFNHTIHHRAQLTVYLRMLEIPVPGLYGPSADEQ